MKEPTWLSPAVVLAIHEAQLAEHAGGAGIRDLGLLESALARPRQVFAYTDAPSIVTLAAAYAVGIARNHPFVDGNKRTAWVLCAVFLELNGRDVIAQQTDVVEVMLAVASRGITEEQFADWLKKNSRAR